MRQLLVPLVVFFSLQAQAVKIISMNVEFFWDTEEPHEGQIVGYGEGKIQPPSSKEFVLKAYGIAKTIEAEDADIVGLIEIENENVVNSIRQYLDSEWKVIFVKGRDTYTGQDVGLLTRFDVIPNTATNFPGYIGEAPDGTDKRPSKVLGIQLTDHTDKYCVYVAHLLSKRGSNDSARLAQADAIRNAVVDQYGQCDHYIVMGDMNDLPGSAVLERLKGQGDPQRDLRQTANTAGNNADYSYVFRGSKQLIDHILVDRDLANGAEFYTLQLPEAITDHRAVILDTR
ncbi:hypothetical protein FKG94_03040 [Exilibacterium tricleocarpae]|uniref:Endonuclease/exonuclease/phosphatase domain-containing protein n=1 Tax=Exilibacterium tricleocarpae TaxID=2591008 RepID=A0A545U6S6_9GAMM|nr:endonuclease/exonuclease/phosphatase family protein [Exilibacterium tricleocarpae]TQV85179.1 hypothetical protein FKG94_03040 [Exilibacterium tricleocarpae]